MRTYHLVLVLFLGVGVLFGVALAVTWAIMEPEDIVWCVILGGGILWTWLLVADVSWRLGQRTPGVEMAEGGGLCFRWRRAQQVILLMVLAHLGAAGLWGWVQLVLGSGPRGAEWWVLLAVAGGCGFLGLLQSVAWVSRGLPRGEVRVDAAGVTCQAWVREFHLAWAEMAATDDGGARVMPLSMRGIRGVDVQSRCRRWFSRPHSLLLRPTSLESDPLFFVHVLAWYAAHPEHREELGDGRALARVLEGRAVVSQFVGKGA